MGVRVVTTPPPQTTPKECPNGTKKCNRLAENQAKNRHFPLKKIKLPRYFWKHLMIWTIYIVRSPSKNSKLAPGILSNGCVKGCTPINVKQCSWEFMTISKIKFHVSIFWLPQPNPHRVLFRFRLLSGHCRPKISISPVDLRYWIETRNIPVVEGLYFNSSGQKQTIMKLSVLLILQMG